MGARDQHRGQEVVDRADVAREDKERPGGGSIAAFYLFAQAEDADAGAIEGGGPPALQPEVAFEVAFAVAATGEPDPAGGEDAGSFAGEEDVQHGEGPHCREAAPEREIDRKGGDIEDGCGKQSEVAGKQERGDGEGAAPNSPQAGLLGREPPDGGFFGHGRVICHWHGMLRHRGPQVLWVWPGAKGYPGSGTR